MVIQEAVSAARIQDVFVQLTPRSAVRALERAEPLTKLLVRLKRDAPREFALVRKRYKAEMGVLHKEFDAAISRAIQQVGRS